LCNIAKALKGTKLTSVSWTQFDGRTRVLWNKYYFRVLSKKIVTHHIRWRSLVGTNLAIYWGWGVVWCDIRKMHCNLFFIFLNLLEGVIKMMSLAKRGGIRANCDKTSQSFDWTRHYRRIRVQFYKTIIYKIL